MEVRHASLIKLEYIRSEVLDFAVLMESVLRKHDETKGTDWGDDECYFLSRIQEETKELEDQIYSEGGMMWNEKAAFEAVDVGNFAMMVASCYQDSKALVLRTITDHLDAVGKTLEQEHASRSIRRTGP